MMSLMNLTIWMMKNKLYLIIYIAYNFNENYYNIII